MPSPSMPLDHGQGDPGRTAPGGNPRPDGTSPGPRQGHGRQGVRDARQRVPAAGAPEARGEPRQRTRAQPVGASGMPEAQDARGSNPRQVEAQP